MNRRNKRSRCVLMMLCLICLTLSCTGCGSKAKELETQLDAARLEIAQLKSQIGVLQGENEMLQRRIDSMAAGISKNEAGNEDEKKEKTGSGRRSKNEPDIRNVNFGDSMETVKQKETELGEPETVSPDNVNKALSYTGYQLAGMEGVLYYMFNDQDELFSVDIIFPVTHVNPSGYLSDFDLIEESLEEKYGKPKEENHNYEKMAEYAPDQASALLLGYGYLSNIWESGDMIIEHYMSGQDNLLLHEIEFKSTRYDKSVDTEGI